MLLESTGFDPRMFASGEELLDYEHVALGGCILLDLCLPGRDGLAVLRHLREDGVTVPIILITAHDQRAERAHGSDGVFAVLRKPIDGDVLLATIERALYRGAGGCGGEPGLSPHP